MISSTTFHMISTDATIGMFVLSGFAFMLTVFNKGPEVRDTVAHWALAGGLIMTPFAIITGVLASPGDGLDNPLLANKLLLSMTATGLAVGLLWRRYRQGPADRLYAAIGMITSGLILTTAGIGGEFTRGESLLFLIPKDIVILFPIWASAIILLLGLAMIGNSTVKHRG